MIVGTHSNVQTATTPATANVVNTVKVPANVQPAPTQATTPTVVGGNIATGTCDVQIAAQVC